MKKFRFISFLFLIITSLGVLCSCKNGKEMEHVHDWDEGKIVKKATCTEGGIKEFSCKNCEEKNNEEIPMIDHNYKEETVVFSCTSGYLLYTCEKCNDTYTVSSDGYSWHVEEIDYGVEATCTSTGLSDGKHCSVCNEILIKQEVIPITEHNYVNDICEDCGFNYYSKGLKFTLSEDGESYSVKDNNVTREKKIVIPSIYNGKPVKSIDDYGFIWESSLEYIEIPDTITRIGSFVFQGCSSLKSIVIPSSVTKIGGSVFVDCSSLENVYYTGTEEQWNNIDIDSFSNGKLKYVTIYYNYVPEE